ncbi:hypothetical protein PFFVO_04301 [Plasmodium falciparum Vietnam Oak-Knoll (FVO)]|uniref:Uncharacterized protein n=1 Tax=Plasmodium falciparum Vietnam Oak-Knoll (FVO) TaxID=1036723 RepID=A0A024V2X2_PLAFA|nr:hypothetical protein PFFVO_04301 [Plasmodium falciparum Vietnam Oak-Knoll (FVO)]
MIYTYRYALENKNDVLKQHFYYHTKNKSQNELLRKILTKKKLKNIENVAY